MKPHSKGAKNQYNNRHKKSKSNKIISKLTYNPIKHKQKVTKILRQKLQQKTITISEPVPPPTFIKFGSFNVNGLDLEAAWAVEQLLKQRGFDVSYNFRPNKCIKFIINRSWH